MSPFSYTSTPATRRVDQVQRLRQRRGAAGFARQARALRRLIARRPSSDSASQTPASWPDSMAQFRGSQRRHSYGNLRPPAEGSQARAAGLIRGTPSGPDRTLGRRYPCTRPGCGQVGRACSGHCNLITGGTLRDRCLTASARPPGRRAAGPHRPVRGSPKQYLHGGRRWCRRRRWPRPTS